MVVCKTPPDRSSFFPSSTATVSEPNLSRRYLQFQNIERRFSYRSTALLTTREGVIGEGVISDDVRL